MLISCFKKDYVTTEQALGCTMRELGVSIDLPNGMAELERYLQSHLR